MPNQIIQDMIQEINFRTTSAEEVVKYHATLLIEDFKVPASYVVDMMHSLKAAVGGEYGD